MLPILWTIPLLLVTVQPRNTAESDRAPAAALRPADPALSAFVAKGLADSATFRDLATRIGAHRGVVYIMWTANLPNRLGAALLHRLTVGPDGTRCVWILVRRGSRADLVSVLGHELQHALEVLDSSAITSNEIESLFRLLDGRGVGPPYETRRAQEVQQRIAAELEAAAARRLPPKE